VWIDSLVVWPVVWQMQKSLVILFSLSFAAVLIEKWKCVYRAIIAAFCSFYVWEILHSTVIKMSKQVKQLQKTIENMRDRLKEYERKVRHFQLLLVMSTIFSGSCIISVWFALNFTVWSNFTLYNFGAFMVALWNSADHYIFALWFLSFFFFFLA